MGNACCGERDRNLDLYDTLEPFSKSDYVPLSAEVRFLSSLSHLSCRKFCGLRMIRKFLILPDISHIFIFIPQDAEKLRAIIELVDDSTKDARVLKSLLTDPEYRKAVNLRESTGFTPLMYAALACHVRKVEALLEAGASVNVIDERGWSCLHLVAKSMHKDSAAVTRLLLEAGADNLIDYQDVDNDKTALHFAAEANNTELINVLLDGGATPSLRNRAGATAEETINNLQVKEMMSRKRSKSISSNKKIGDIYMVE